MNWAAPHWLWTLLALPLLYIALLQTQKGRRERFTKFAREEVWAKIAPEIDFGARMRKGRVWILALGFVILALARPQWGSHEESIHVSGLDIVLALDVSNSMAVEDIVPSRLKKAQHWIHTLVDRLGGDRVGLVAFAASSYMAAPLTSDVDYIKETVESLDFKTILNQGTDIGSALDTAARALDRGAEEQSGKEASNGNKASTSSRVVVLISDGEDQEDQAETVAKKLKDAGIRVYVLGVGTAKGGPIPTRDENGQLRGFKRSRRGETVVSTFRPDALMGIARAAGGRYWSVTETESEVEELLGDMGALNRKDYAERKYLVYEDRFQWPLLIAVLLLLLELSIPAHRLLKGPVLRSALLMGLTGLCGLFGGSFDAQAATPLKSYLENEKALRAFESGKLDEAKKDLGNAQAVDPDSHELKYNQGVIQLKDGDVDGAIQSFEGAVQGAAQRKDPSFESVLNYNLGAAKAKKGDVGGAVDNYLKAIEQAKLGKNPRLEADARKNLQLLIQEREKKKQQEKQDQQKGEGKDKKDQPSQGGNGDSKDPQSGKDRDKQDPEDPKDGKDSGKDKQGPPKEYEDNSKGKRSFKSQKLSKEDADRVMNELSGKEKELQGKLRRQKGNPQAQEKDW